MKVSEKRALKYFTKTIVKAEKHGFDVTSGSFNHESNVLKIYLHKDFICIQETDNLLADIVRKGKWKILSCGTAVERCPELVYTTELEIRRIKK